MIYGKSYAKRRADNRALKRFFAWFPVKLHDGTKAWLCDVVRVFDFADDDGVVFTYCLPKKK